MAEQNIWFNYDWPHCLKLNSLFREFSLQLILNEKYFIKRGKWNAISWLLQIQFIHKANRTNLDDYIIWFSIDNPIQNRGGNCLVKSLLTKKVWESCNQWFTNHKVVVMSHTVPCSFCSNCSFFNTLSQFKE